jgi:hypothetical protein
MESKIQSILHNVNLTERERVDELLFLDVQMYANIGTDSSDYDKTIAKANSILIYEAIKTVDFDMGTSFLLLQN